MEVLETVEQVREWRERQGTVGLAPTMGYLHPGHLSLVRRARAENDAAAASIFVNPSQFGPGEDLAAYPRNLSRDLDMLAGEGCAMVFAPPDAEMYPADYQTWIEVGAVAEALEGARRPGHFRGVATVVAKLLGIVRPDRAYFGRKDAQQLAVIRTVARDLNLAVEIVGCPTVREADGLAMSSRNTYLDPAQRRAAAVLYRALTAVEASWREGERDAESLRGRMRAVLDAEPLAQTEYVSVADPVTLRELDEVGAGALVSMAVRIGRTRLIDNLVLGGESGR